jgi:hypothetical protein
MWGRRSPRGRAGRKKDEGNTAVSFSLAFRGLTGTVFMLFLLGATASEGMAASGQHAVRSHGLPHAPLPVKEGSASRRAQARVPQRATAMPAAPAPGGNSLPARRPLAGAMALPAGISGSDDRTPDLGSLAPLRPAVGRLLVPAGRGEVRECSAFCVDERWIMTAAHCLAGLSRLPRRVRFLLTDGDGRQRRVAILRSAADSAGWGGIVGGVAFPAPQSRTSIRPDRDWALLPLARPACRQVIPVRSPRALSSARARTKARTGEIAPPGSLAVLAHHGDRGHARLLATRGCGLAHNPDARALRLHLPPGVILHDCDLTFGASGSPLLWLGENGHAVAIGVNVAIFERNLLRALPARNADDGGGDDGFVANMAVSAAVFAATVEALRQEGPPLTTPATIARLQRLLRASGHDPGPVDGILGPRTRRALIAFRRSQGMQPVALATPVILETLRETVGAAAVMANLKTKEPRHTGRKPPGYHSDTQHRRKGAAAWPKRKAAPAMNENASPCGETE